MKSLLLTLGLMTFATLKVTAQPVTNIPSLGPHFPVLTVEKNVNPQNIMTVYTRLNADCALELNADLQPELGFYWLMDRAHFKPVHPLIRSEVEKRLELQAHSHAQPSRSFSVLINDLKELDHDLKDPRITVQTTGSNGQCSVQGLLTLGPSDGNRILILQSIYSETRGRLKPKVVAVTLKGIDLNSGAPLSRTYHGQ